MNMSRAVLRVLTTCDLIQGCIDSVRGGYRDNGLEMPQHVKRILFDLEMGKENASIYACQRLDASGKWNLDAEATARYVTALESVQSALERSYGSPDGTLDAKEFVKAVQVWVEDVRATLPVHPVDRRIIWSEIATTMQALYSVFDPEWTADDAIDSGMAKGETMKQHSGIWP